MRRQAESNLRTPGNSRFLARRLMRVAAIAMCSALALAAWMPVATSPAQDALGAASAREIQRTERAAVWAVSVVEHAEVLVAAPEETAAYLPIVVGAGAWPGEQPEPLPTTHPGPRPTPPHTFDTPGLFALTSSYVLLQLEYGPQPTQRRFHFGTGQTAFTRVDPVAGDFDGDGADTVGFYDRRAAVFVLHNANAAGAPDLTFAFGRPGNIGIAGDFDGDGVDTIGVFDPNTNVFRLRNTNSPGAADREFSFAAVPVRPGGGDREQRARPIAGDFDADGIDTVGLLDATTGQAYLLNTHRSGDADVVVDTGHPGLTPVVGDFNGDGVDTLGMYDGRANVFYLRDSHDARAPERAIPFGAAAAMWVPLAGRWDRRGETGETSGFVWLRSAPQDAGFDPQQLAAGYAAAARIANLHSLLVVRHGRLVGEEYFNGYDASMANDMKSASKSVLSALVGLAVEKGYLTGTQQTVASILPEHFAVGAEPRLTEITLQHLLTMSSGQSWDDARHIGPMVASDDWVGFVAARPFTDPPGSRWNYSTGLTHVASAVLTRASGQSTREFATRHLFRPLGISVTRWDHDPQGVDFGGAEVWMRPRDMARFGELYLRAGRLDGRQIIDPEWVHTTTAALLPAYGSYDYGAWWWRRRFAGHEVYFAWGYGGQFVFVVPDEDMVVVATSSWFRGPSAATNSDVFRLLARYIIPAAASDRVANSR